MTTRAELARHLRSRLVRRKIKAIHGISNSKISKISDNHIILSYIICSGCVQMQKSLEKIDKVLSMNPSNLEDFWKIYDRITEPHSHSQEKSSINAKVQSYAIMRKHNAE